MASTLKTPGVYVEEISTFPPSVAQVPTAIPAFVGYTEKQGINGDLGMKPKKIRSLLEFELLYGKAPKGELTVKLDFNNAVTDVSEGKKRYLYNSLKLFYNNGGGDCYIVSIGKYTDGITKANFTDGIDSLKKIDEPTLYVAPDAALLSDINEFKDVHSKMLDECESLQDRFAILDVFQGDDDITDIDDVIKKYRNALPSNTNLKYGACYYPFLRTSLAMSFNYSDLTLKNGTGDLDFKTIIVESKFSDGKTETLTNLDKAAADYKSIKEIAENHSVNAYKENTGSGQRAELNAKIDFLNGYFSTFIEDTITNASIKTIFDALNGTNASVTNLALAYDEGIEKINEKLSADLNLGESGVTSSGSASFKVELKDVTGDSNPIGPVYNIAKDFLQKVYDQLNKLVSDFYQEAAAVLIALEDTLKTESPVYAGIVAGIKQHGVVLPPSGAVAGVYAKVDAQRGVWKAPANIGLNSVNEPVVRLSAKDQESLNVDVDAGKSINVIRAFTGKGNLVWGARTLAGNDNEWRYISVRRFYNMVEESVKKATEPFVFEPNDANTWVRVRSMIENFLTNQWRAGALAGAKTDDAFYVRVGLGQTMTSQDILNGIMNVEIGMAVVRPAEFIVLKFSHKLQES